MKVRRLMTTLDGTCSPLVEIQGVTSATLVARCEGHNEYGSIKSGMVRHLLQQAMAQGRLERGDRVVEASSGNTGIALAGIGAELGLKVSIVLLEGADAHIVGRLESLGVDIHYCDRQGGMRGMLAYIRSHFPDTFSIDQFRNKLIVPAYVETHERQLMAQLDAIEFIPDYLFACVGTGGTLQGIGTILRKRWPKVCIVAVEKESAAAPIDGIRNTQVAYFGDVDIYDKGFPDETVHIGECPRVPDELEASPSCAALLEAIRRYPMSEGERALAVFCDARLRPVAGLD